MTDHLKNPAIVLGLDVNALGIIRSLEKAGIPVIALGGRPRNLAAPSWASSHTRLCEKVFVGDPGRDDAWLECLMTLGERLPRPGVLFPSTDQQLLLISEHRDALGRFYHFLVPNRETVELVCNKSLFYRFALEHGFDIPRTFFDCDPGAVEEISDRIAYPCLIKPYNRDANWRKHFGGHKVLIAYNRCQLITRHTEVSRVHRDLLIQEIIPGPDSQLLFSHLYIDKSGRLAAAWTGRKIRQRPVGFGTSTMAETLWDPMVAELSSSLMCAIGARGYASVEFKRDPGSDSYKLIEATVARTWYPHYLGTVAGVNLSLVWYRDLIGAELPRTRRVADGVKWIDEYRDVWGGYERWREHGLPLADWVCSYRGTKAFALASLRDPLPSLCLVVKILLDIAARLRKVLVDAVSNRQPELGA